MRSQDRFRGCLIGGAAGDALGYAVEFLREPSIFRLYGSQGITEYALTKGKALFSDDTQMTLFTATGLLRCAALAKVHGTAERYAEHINRSYLDWLKTQEGRYPAPGGQRTSWLLNVPELFSPRAPGNTCLAALHAGGGGTPEKPLNDSKGCGGVMRVAPVGLYFAGKPQDLRAVCRIGAEAAALTHGHPLGWIPAAMLAGMIHEIGQNGAEIPEAALHALEVTADLWANVPDMRSFVKLIRKAVDLAAGDTEDLAAIHQLGEGWVGDEALAIAVYCAVRHSGDLDKTLIAAVNHNGDSDSTGAIAGNIVGAQVGLSGIPAKYTENLELRDLIIEIADDLWADFQSDPVWNCKYLDAAYAR